MVFRYACAVSYPTIEKGLCKMADHCNKRKPNKQDEPPRLMWNGEMVEDVLNALYQCKCIMEFNNSDFSTDKAKQYEAMRLCIKV